MLHTADVQPWRRTPGLFGLQRTILCDQIKAQWRQLVQQARPIGLPYGHKPQGRCHQPRQYGIQVGQQRALNIAPEPLGYQSKDQSMMPWRTSALYLCPEGLHQRRWLQSHGGAQKCLARVLALLAQLTWHFIGGQEMVAGDQSRERVVGGVCAGCETVGMGTKHQVAWANSVPAQVCE